MLHFLARMLHRGLLFFDKRNTYHPKKSSPAASQVIRFRIRLPAGSAFCRPVRERQTTKES